VAKHYQDAVACVARWVDERLARQFPDHDRIFVANPTAGTRHRHRTIQRIAAARCTGSGELPEIWWTHSGEEARSLLAARMDAATAPPVVVSLGGDGTHNHVLQAGVEHRDRALFLRLPMGSGNDAAGVASLDEALDRLEGVLSPQWIPAVAIRAARSTHYAFNIVSLGLDAYVTILHDRWRRLLPGNTYRLLVDLAVLGYDRALSVGPMALSGTRFDGRRLDIGEEARSLVAMGAGGHRTYGDHMRVLPGDENLCVIRQVGLWDKIRMKRLFYDGRHVDESITAMFGCRTLDVGYDGRMPLQYDGEPLWLEQGDFPVRLEVVDRAARVLEPDRLA